MSDLSAIIIWWLTIFLLGLIFLPLTLTLFKKFIDAGFVFSKVIGLLLASYFVWLLGSFNLLPFTRPTIIIVLLGAAVANLWWWTFNRERQILKFSWRFFLFEEGLFLLALSFWSYIRATEPSIRGLEKFMDFGFVNSILRGNFFPPLDMWLTASPDYFGGYFINYYYFGHYLAAFLTKLSGLDSAITYNLMIATLFAFTFSLSFSIGMNLYYLFLSFRGQSRNLPLKDMGNRSLHSSQVTSGSVGMTARSITVGLLAAFLVALAGNLHTLYSFTEGYPNEAPKPPWELALGFHPERYWYPNATRFIPFTIHEFPIYSFVVADLHGHVSDIPFVFLALALFLSLIVRRPTVSHLSNLGNLRKFLTEFENHTSIPLYYLILLGVLLASMYMTNAWDSFIYMTLAGLVFLYLNLQKITQAGLSLASAFYKTFSSSLFLLFFFLVFSLPFSFAFRPFVSGIGVLCPPSFLLGKTLGPFLFEAGKCQKSPLYQMVILWGFFYFNVIGYLLFVIIPTLKKKWEVGNEKLEKEVGRGKKISHFPFQYLTSHFSRLTSNLSLLSPVDVFVLLLIFISTLLLIFPEFFYIKDIYPAHYRANTMFKLGYQAFMMLGFTSAYIFFRLNSRESFQKTLKTQNVSVSVSQKFRKSDILINRLSDWLSFLSIPRLFGIWKLGFGILFFLVAIYPYFAINSYYGGLKTYHGLDGFNWLAASFPSDYQSIKWLRENVKGQPVIVEAQGESYTDYARVSANTGLPTIIGWPVHEWLWRGSYDEAGRRIPEVAAIYEAKDLAQTKEILRKYQVEYIFVGSLEREKYKNLEEEKLEKLGKVVFESGKTKIYKLKI